MHYPKEISPQSLLVVALIESIKMYVLLSRLVGQRVDCKAVGLFSHPLFFSSLTLLNWSEMQNTFNHLISQGRRLGYSLSLDGAINIKFHTHVHLYIDSICDV